MDFLGAPFKPPKNLGLSAADAARYAESAHHRANVSASAGDAAGTAAAGRSRPTRNVPCETEDRREARLNGGGVRPPRSSTQREPGGENIVGEDYDYGGGFDDGFFGGRDEDDAAPPAVSAYVEHYNSFVKTAASDCATTVSSLSVDLQLRKSVHNFERDQRKILIDNAWTLHSCAFAACAQARLRGTDPAALKAQYVEMKDGKADCIVVQVNTSSHAELQRLPLFCCQVCKKNFRAKPSNFGCSQGSHEYAAHGTTQLFTNEVLDSVLPLARRRMTIKSALDSSLRWMIVLTCVYAIRMLGPYALGLLRADSDPQASE